MFVSFCGRRNCCFRGWKKSHRRVILRKEMFAWSIHFVAFDVSWWIWESNCILSGSYTGESVLALQVKLWKRGRVFEDKVFIENTYLGIGSKKRGKKFKWGHSFKHWSRGSPRQWFPETEYLRASAIFVAGTSGIPPILNYRSVSPIHFILMNKVIICRRLEYCLDVRRINNNSWFFFICSF